MVKNICVLIVIITCFQFAASLRVSVWEEKKCQPIQSWDMSQTTNYNIAYDWTHHSELKNCKFTCNDHKPNCCITSYNTQIHIPFFIQKILLRSNSNNKIVKETCWSENDFNEKVQIFSIPVIDTMQIALYAKTTSNNRVVVTIDTLFDVPWYLYPMEQTIHKHVHKSLEEYVDIFTRHFCVK